DGARDVANRQAKCRDAGITKEGGGMTIAAPLGGLLAADDGVDHQLMVCRVPARATATGALEIRHDGDVLIEVGEARVELVEGRRLHCDVRNAEQLRTGLQLGGRERELARRHEGAAELDAVRAGVRRVLLECSVYRRDLMGASRS